LGKTVKTDNCGYGTYNWNFAQVGAVFLLSGEQMDTKQVLTTLNNGG
jgi:hypothetical protein